MTEDTASRGPGRTSTYTDALAQEICERLSKGETLTSICSDDHMPATRTVSDWKKSNEAFAADFARARDEGFDALAEQCLEIAEDGSRDYTEKTRPDGSKYEAFDAEHVQRSKLRIETRLKLLAKWDPKRYGDKLDVAHGGDVGLTVNIRRFTPDADAG